MLDTNHRLGEKDCPQFEKKMDNVGSAAGVAPWPSAAETYVVVVTALVQANIEHFTMWGDVAKATLKLNPFIAPFVR